MNIQFDERNLHARMVGETNGLTDAEIAKAQVGALKALSAVQSASDQNTYGFPHLPFQSDLIKSIVDYAKEVEGTYNTVCVVGIGGSALGAWALDCGIHGPHPIQSKSHPRAGDPR